MVDKKNTTALSEETKSVQREKEKLLKKAQRFVYPIGSTRRRITIISTSIFIGFVLSFVVIATTMVYGFHSESTFTYQLSRILPLPIGRVDSNLVTYEEYLFEIRYAKHYLIEKEGVDPSSTTGTKLIERKRKEALNKVYINALAENFASAKNITVTDDEIAQRITILKTQAVDFSPDQIDDKTKKPVGTEDPRFEQILSEFYGWTERDLERALRLQILKSKLPEKIDVVTKKKAEKIHKSVVSNPQGFADTAKQESQDPKSAEIGGDLGFLNDQNSVAYPKEFLQSSRALKDGEVSEVLTTEFGYHIVMRTETNDQKEARVSHILLKFRDADEILSEELKNHTVQKFDSITD